MKKFNRNYSLVIFYNKKWEILFQNRKSISKIWEEYWFFGGGVEDGESFEVAIIREIKEELNLDINPEDIFHAFDFSKNINWLWSSKTLVFIGEFLDTYNDNLKILEWDDWEWLTIDRIKTKQVFPHDYLIIDMLEDYFSYNKLLW